MQTIHISDIQPLSQRSLVYVTVCVVLLHAFLFLWMYLEPSSVVSVKKGRKEHVTVSTVSLKPKPVEAEKAVVAPSKPSAVVPQKVEKKTAVEKKTVVAVPMPTPTSPKSIKKTTPIPKPAAKKTEAPKKMVSKSKPTTAPILDSAAQEKVLKAQAILLQMKSTNEKVVAIAPTTSSLPGVISRLESDKIEFDHEGGIFSSQDMSYEEEIKGHLKRFLKLPEHGTVQIKLMISRNGKAKVAILNAESITNKKYLEETVPTLTFPPFGDNFEKLSEKNYTITIKPDV